MNIWKYFLLDMCVELSKDYYTRCGSMGVGSVSKNRLKQIIFPPFFPFHVDFIFLYKICSFLLLTLEQIHSIWEGLYRVVKKPQRR